MTEEKKDKPKKIWRVLRNVPAPKLEDQLNEMALEGYQAFRIDRFMRPHPRIADHDLPWYDVVLFNPVLVGELNAAGMAGMLARVSADAAKVAGTVPK